MSEFLGCRFHPMGRGMLFRPWYDWAMQTKKHGGATARKPKLAKRKLAGNAIRRTKLANTGKLAGPIMRSALPSSFRELLRVPRDEQQQVSRKRHKGSGGPEMVVRRAATSDPSSKFAVSFARSLAEQVQLAAEAETGGNVSAWMAEAARDRLRQRALAAAVAAYEAEHGLITDSELEEVRKEWPRG